MEKQQADKAKKQAEAFSTATELTKENVSRTIIAGNLGRVF